MITKYYCPCCEDDIGYFYDNTIDTLHFPKHCEECHDDQRKCYMCKYEFFANQRFECYGCGLILCDGCAFFEEKSIVEYEYCKCCMRKKSREKKYDENLEGIHYRLIFN